MMRCLCGFTCGTKIALERHYARFPDDASGSHGPAPLGSREGDLEPPAIVPSKAGTQRAPVAGRHRIDEEGSTPSQSSARSGYHRTSPFNGAPGEVKVLFVRHARSGNKARAKGEAASEDPALSDLGYDQADCLAKRLEVDFRNKKEGSVIVASSPMRRCLLTILPSIRRLDLLRPGDRLCHGGCYEFGCAGRRYPGSSEEEISEDFPEFQTVGFSPRGTWDYRGDHSMETEVEARGRAYRVVDWIWEVADELRLRPLGRCPRTLVLTIHQTMADLVCRILIDGSDSDWRYGEIKYPLHNAGITEVVLDANGARFGVRNAWSHLFQLEQKGVGSLSTAPSCSCPASPKDAKIEVLKRRFRKFDVNGDRKLDFEEMATLLRKGNASLSDADLKVLFKGADKNLDGCLDFDEFVEYIFKS